MLDRLLTALCESKNGAADDVLLEALSLGVPSEQAVVLRALLQRKTVRGMGGVIEQFDSLPEPLQREVLAQIKQFHHALRECGRSDRTELRLAAMKLIAIGRQGKLAYVLSENLHESEESRSKAATDAMVALARWVAFETRAGQRRAVTPLLAINTKSVADADAGAISDETDAMIASDTVVAPEPDPQTLRATYEALIAERPEIEAAVARAMDVHRGRHGQELLRAALLLCDWPGSKTLGILHTTKHGGQSPMVRRLQQPPASEHVDAFLLGATHGQLRSHFGVVFSHIDEAPVLDALLRKTHWLKDHQLQLCMHQVSRGAWWSVGDLRHDLERRPPEDAARVGEWVGTSGLHDTMQDELLEELLRKGRDSFEARLRLLRIAAHRKNGASVRLLIVMLNDSDERIVRMAARELVRRRPADYENVLLQLMTNAPESVRKVISRSIGQVGFEQYWQRFDRLDRTTRRSAGKAMLKLLPDAILRLQRRLSAGAPEQRIKAMQVAQELDLVEGLRDTLARLCVDSNPRLRSKAVSAMGKISEVPTDLMVDRLINDTDARVRANAIEVLETRPQLKILPALAQRARASNSRERANAIKALNTMHVKAASGQLLLMLRDPRPEHRVSAMWALKQIGWWQMLNEVGRLAKEDDNLRVRRYALSVLRGVAEMARARKVEPAPAG